MEAQSLLFGTVHKYAALCFEKKTNLQGLSAKFKISYEMYIISKKQLKSIWHFWW